MYVYIDKLCYKLAKPFEQNLKSSKTFLQQSFTKYVR